MSVVASNAKGMVITGGGGGGGGGAVLSVFGRIGAVVAQLNDYAASLVDNDSGVSGATVKDALDSIAAGILALTSSDIGNASGVSGATVTDALDALLASLTALTNPTWVSVPASRAMLASDAGKILYFNSGSTINYTVNTSIMSAGQFVYLVRAGVGAVNIVPGTCTVNASNNLRSLAYQNSTGALWFETAAICFMSGERA